MRSRMLCVLVLAALSAACGAGTSGPSAGPSVAPTGERTPPAPTSTPARAELVYFVFGDSVMWGLEEAYEAEIERALDVEVLVRNRTQGGDYAAHLLSMLTSPTPGTQTLRDELSKADVITVEIPVHEYQAECGMDETTVAGTRACMTRAREQIVASADEILDAIAELRSPDDALIRVIVSHLFFYGIHREQGTATEALAQWSAMNASIEGFAAEHGFRVVSLWDALMGPDAKTEPMAAGLVEDGIHLTPKGIEVAVQALVASGFDDAPVPASE